MDLSLGLLLGHIRSWWLLSGFFPKPAIPEPWINKYFGQGIKIFLLITYLVLAYAFIAFILRKYIRKMVVEFAKNEEKTSNVTNSPNRCNSIWSPQTMLTFVMRNTTASGRWRGVGNHSQHLQTEEPNTVGDNCPGIVKATGLTCTEIQTQTESFEEKMTQTDGHKKIEYILSRGAENMCDTNTTLWTGQHKLNQKGLSSKYLYTPRQRSREQYTVYYCRSNLSQYTTRNSASTTFSGTYESDQYSDDLSDYSSGMRRRSTECSFRSKNGYCTKFTPRGDRFFVQRDRCDQVCQRVQPWRSRYTKNCREIVGNKFIIADRSEATIQNKQSSRDRYSDVGSEYSSGIPRVQIEFNVKKPYEMKCKSKQAKHKPCTKCGKCLTHQGTPRQREDRNEHKAENKKVVGKQQGTVKKGNQVKVSSEIKRTVGKEQDTVKKGNQVTKSPENADIVGKQQGTVKKGNQVTVSSEIKETVGKQEDTVNKGNQVTVSPTNADIVGEQQDTVKKGNPQSVSPIAAGQFERKFKIERRRH